VTYAARTPRKTPVFTAVAILTLALGVGANSAIFSLISTVLLRPLPFTDPDRLTFVWENTALFGLKDSVVALANYVDWRDQNHAFQQMGVVETNLFTAIGAGEPVAIQGVVTASLFSSLGVRPALGRGFRGEEDRPTSDKTVILSDGLWRRLFGGDPAAIGKTLNLENAPYTIVGVMATRSFGYRPVRATRAGSTPIADATTGWRQRGWRPGVSLGACQ